MTREHPKTAGTNANTLTQAGSGVLLPGLDGTNPLGFLAALGVFRMLANCRGAESVRMKWSPSGGTWVPMISTGSGDTPDQDAILDVLCNGLAKDIAAHPAQLLNNLKTAGDANPDRRRVFTDVLSQRDPSAADGRAWTDWLASVASDIAPADAINQLQTARRDYYYKNLASVIEKTTRDHLRRSLFQSWDYADPLDNQSLHLDPSEDRRHAHQWNQPSGDPGRKKSGGMLGANRLAIEAIPLFTSLPEGGTLRTIGFSGNRSTDTRWTWPIWNVGVTLSVVRSLLLLPELQKESPKPAEVAVMRARSIVAVYRTHRILVGKTPNFTPARRIA
jgi:CRISPR-associated endonuclease/helicase Cas3